VNSVRELGLGEATQFFNRACVHVWIGLMEVVMSCC